MTITERPLQTPCEWCGNAVEQAATGRLRRYCDRSCRQRAYEARTARRRLQEDVDAGIVRTEPAERVVERVIHRRHPDTVRGWVAALGELSAQLRDGRFAPWQTGELRHALGELVAVLPPLESGQSPRSVVAPQPPGPRVDERLRAAILHRLQVAGGTVTTSLTRLSADLDTPVGGVRQAVLDLVGLHVVQTRRRGLNVDVDQLVDNAKFDLVRAAPLR